MIPPICRLCGRDFRARWANTGQGGVLINFADQRDVWFCDEHAEEAQRLLSLSSDKALKKLNEKYSLAPLDHQKDYDVIPDPQLWIIDTGQNIDKVIPIVKEATGLTTQESLDLITQRQAPAIVGPFNTLQSYRMRLAEIGVESEIYFNDQETPSLAPFELLISAGPSETERIRRPPEGGKSLPLTWFFVILILLISTGYFFGAWWVLIIFGGFLSVGIISIVVRWKIENR